jgi:hypothetical protein
MIYEWKDKNSGKIVEVERKLEDYDVPPTVEETGLDGDEVEWVKIISQTSTPFEQLRDKGVFDRTHFKRGT